PILVDVASGASTPNTFPICASSPYPFPIATVSDAAAKVGNYPFTTIKPNHGVAYVTVDCPCKRFGKENQCSPKHGKCEGGVRHVPIQILDVAGLVPGASRGESQMKLILFQGLGNQFLDDLRTADLLIHVVDASGTTDAAGKVTQGYDPINDIDWLRGEIHRAWSGSQPAETLQLQFSGYGSTLVVTQRALDRSGVKDPLDTWSDETIAKVVDAFLDERFPTIIALNKIDLPDSDKNIDRICRKYDPLHKQGFIRYFEGTDRIDLPEQDQDSTAFSPDAPPLKPLPANALSRIEKVQDLVLFRYGTTGIQQALRLCVSTLGLIPTYPVRSVTTFGDESGGKSGVFRDCLLLRAGTRVRDLMQSILGESARFCLYAETVGSIRLSEDDVITNENNIISFKLSADAVKK
ncbi:hypothetical protein HK405_010368, partial [Cladochytrium tenue]